MALKRVIAGAAVVAVLTIGGFVAGGINQSITSAQVPTATTAQQNGVLTMKSLSTTNQSASRAEASSANKSANKLVTNSVTQQNQALPAQTVEPTEIAEPTEVEQTPEPTGVAGTPEPTEVAGNDGDNVQQGDQNGPDTGATGEADSPQENSASEATDAQALAPQASITQQQAEQAALSANPGTAVLNSSLGDENGTVVYDVEMSNSSDVKVNAQSGAIISTDVAGSDGAKNGGNEGTQAP